jgi:hypothetical protein
MADLNPNNATVHGVRRFSTLITKTDTPFVYKAVLIDRATDTREEFKGFGFDAASGHKRAAKAAYRAASDILFHENAARAF